MKKVINITLGGQVFAIEQIAYDELEKYVEAIKQTLTANDDVDEIVSDIETAMAEKMIARGRSEKIAISEADVVVVIAEMGAPTEFGEGGGESKESTHNELPKNEVKKRLYRDTDDVIVAGVASGIARYFDIDPVIVRLIFAASVLLNGFGLLVYLMLWLVVPAAKTTTEKYAMSGDKVTLKEITDRVKKNLESIEKEDFAKAKGVWSRVRSVLERIFSAAGTILRGLAEVLRYVIGFALSLGGALAVASLVSAYTVVLLSDNILLPADAQAALQILLSNPIGIIAITASFVMMTIPFLVLVLAGGSLIAKRVLFTVTKSITLAVIWIIAVVLAFTTSALQLEQVAEEVGPIHTDDGTYEITVKKNEHGISVDIDEVVEEEEEHSLPPDDAPIETPVLQ